MRFVIGLLVFTALVLSACSRKASLTPVFHHSDNPAVLADWNIISIEGGALNLAPGSLSYDLNTPLFSDYAHKLRTVWIPDGRSAVYADRDVFDFPVGTIITKTFYYMRAGDDGVAKTEDLSASRLLEGFRLDDVTLIETRLLVRRQAGWEAIPYVWNAEQTEARLKRTGDIKPLTLIDANGDRTSFSYVVPNVNQCAGCHAENATTKALKPIGPKARHLNRDYEYAFGPKNQLQAWVDQGVLTDVPLASLPKNADWNDPAYSLNARARAYLDINCSHCHNENGPADTSGLILEANSPEGVSLGHCKRPIAAGTGTGGHRFDIVPGKPEDSIFTYRIRSTNPAEMMPELGRSLAHNEGAALISDWIAAMEGSCG